MLHTQESSVAKGEAEKIGCPTWIRTMTKASKGPCATVTPSDNPRAKLLELCFRASVLASAQIFSSLQKEHDKARYSTIKHDISRGGGSNFSRTRMGIVPVQVNFHPLPINNSSVSLILVTGIQSLLPLCSRGFDPYTETVP
jgi:hypothetical protein